MYYSEDIVEQVRSRNPIVDVIGSYVHLTKKGGNYFGLCPFHNEKTPSFSVSASKQMFHCFGCGKGGNVVTFIMEYENATFPEALEILANRAGITLPKREMTGEERKETDRRTRLLAIQKDAALFYCHVLKTPEGKIGLEYLHRRQISDEMIRSFGLGYSPMKSGALYQYLRKKGYHDDELKESGIIRITEKGGQDVFWNRVMFPIMDPSNRVIGFGGRVMGNAEPKYLNSPETRLFDKSRNLYGLNAAKRTRQKFMLVCEGYVDVIALHQAGFTNAVASLGTAFTSQHAMILKRYVSEVILCYDSDGAGKKAAMRAIPILREAGLRIKVLDMSPYKDPDEFIKNLGAEAFQTRIDEAENAFLYQVATIRNEYDFSDPDDKASFMKSAASMLADIDDEIERNSYIEATANRFGIDYGVLKSRVVEIGNRKGILENQEKVAKPQSPFRAKEQKNGAEEAEKLVITELSEHPEHFKKIAEVLSPSDFSEGILRDAAGFLFDQIEKTGRVNIASILDRFVEGDQVSQAASLFSSDFMEGLSEDVKKTALAEAVLRVKEASFDRQIKETTDAVKFVDLMKEKQKYKERRIRF